MNSEMQIKHFGLEGQGLMEETNRMIRDIHKALFACSKLDKQASREQSIADKKAKMMVKAIRRT